MENSKKILTVAGMRQTRSIAARLAECARKSTPAFLLILVLTLPLQAQIKLDQSKLESISRGAMYMAVGTDLGTTWYGIQKDGRTEANPALNLTPGLNARHKMIVQGSTLIGLTVGSDFLTYKLKQAGHPKLAILGRFAISLTHGYATYRNLR